MQLEKAQYKARTQTTGSRDGDASRSDDGRLDVLESWRGRHPGREPFKLVFPRGRMIMFALSSSLPWRSFLQVTALSTTSIFQLKRE